MLDRLVRNVLFPLHEFVRGHETLRIMRDMKSVEKLSAADLRLLINQRLQRFIRSTYRNVPYVARAIDSAGLKPTDIQTVEDLRNLPVMRKSDIRQHRAELRSRSCKDLISFTTGGSTGEPLIFDISKRRIASHVACRQRVGRWWGVSIGVPEAVIWGSPVEITKQHRVRELRDRLFRTRLLSAFEMDDRRISNYLNVLERDGIKQIFGYPSSVCQLCTLASKQGRDMRKLGIKVVFVTSEVLLPHQRALIEDTFGCKVGNGYGGRDSGFISHECPAGGMHIMADATVVEILDECGQPVPDGEIGEIVVTDLYSEGAPFLRYATGDLGSKSSRICPCRLPLPLLENIQGRANDMVVTADGRVMNSLSLIYAVREVNGIDEFRVIQTDYDQFRVLLATGDSYQRSGEEHIRQAWSKLVRARINVDFEYVDHLPSEKSGKHRHVISNVKAVPAVAQQ